MGSLVFLAICTIVVLWMAWFLVQGLRNGRIRCITAREYDLSIEVVDRWQQPFRFWCLIIGLAFIVPLFAGFIASLWISMLSATT